MQRTPMNKRTAGFTLIELMIVVLVVSILVGVAIPTYQTQIRKSRRTDAKTALLDMAGRQAKFLTLNNSFSATPANVGYTGSFPQNIGNNYYQIYVCMGTAPNSTASTTPCTAVSAAATGTSFVIAAIPNTGTSQIKDSLCQYFAIDNTGTQYSADSTAGTGTNTTSTCWQ